MPNKKYKVLIDGKEKKRLALVTLNIMIFIKKYPSASLIEDFSKRSCKCGDNCGVKKYGLQLGRWFVGFTFLES